MARHILDHPRTDSAPRLPGYLGRERAGPHPASAALIRRPRAEAPRLGVYSRLERQRDRDA